MNILSVTVTFIGLVLLGFGVAYIFQAIAQGLRARKKPVPTQPAKAYKTPRESKVAK
jgi:hypothetical protein